MNSTIQCPYCQGGVEYAPAYAGSMVSCPHCQRPFQMPLPQAAPPQQNQPQSAESSSFEDEPSSFTPRRKRKPQGGGKGLIIVVALLGAPVLVGGGLWAAGVFNAPKEGANTKSTPESPATTPSPKSSPKTNPTPSPKSDPSSKPKSTRPEDTTEEEAKQMLKAVLDARQRGETFDQYKKAHPNVQLVGFIDGLNVFEGVLLKHEIAAGAADEEMTAEMAVRYKFQVTLVFQSQAGTELRNSALFRAARLKNGDWLITFFRI